MKIESSSRGIAAAQADTVESPLELYPGERVWFTRQRGLEGVEVLHGRDSPRLWKVWHDTYTLCIVYQIGSRGDHGGSFWRYRGHDQATGPGEVMLMEPGEVHVTRRIEGGTGSFDVFMVQPELVEQIASELDLRGPFHLSRACSGDPQLYHALEALARGIYLKDEPAAQRERLVLVLWLLLTRCAEGQAQQREALSKIQVARACRHLERHCTEPFDLDRLTAACGASKSSLCHVLPASIGVTPRELHSVLRARRVKEWLAMGIPPSEVVAQAGFSDQPQLTHHFRRFWGITPARYARMVGSRP